MSDADLSVDFLTWQNRKKTRCTQVLELDPLIVRHVFNRVIHFTCALLELEEHR